VQQANLSRCLAAAILTLRSGGGPRRPNAARALCEESILVDRPSALPARPHFSSGPCAKPPGWSPSLLRQDALGRSHRAALGKARLQEAIERTHALLGLPADFRLGIVPASDTGAMELAIWSLLGARPVTMLAWESFGQGWVTDVAKQL
jgi:phosphoserine aminotransferase